MVSQEAYFTDYQYHQLLPNLGKIPSKCHQKELSRQPIRRSSTFWLTGRKVVFSPPLTASNSNIVNSCILNSLKSKKLQIK